MINSLHFQKKDSEPEQSPVGELMIVQCVGSRCLGYRTTDNRWLTVYGDREIKNIISFLPVKSAK